MAKAKPKKPKQILIKPHLLPTFLFILLIMLTLITYQVIFIDKYYPFTFIGDTNVTFLTKSQTIRFLSANLDKRAQQKLPFDGFTIDLATSSAKLDYSVIDQTFTIGHSGSFRQKFEDQFNALIFKTTVIPKVSFNLDKQLETIAALTYKAPQDAQLNFSETTTPEGSPSAQIQIKKAQEGRQLDREKLISQIENFLILGKLDDSLPLKAIQPKISTERVKRAKLALESSVREPIKLRFEGNVWLLNTKQLLTLLDLESDQDLLLDKDKAYLYIKEIVQTIDTKVQEGLFEFNPQTLRVTAFRPSREGKILDQDKTFQLLTDAVASNEQRIINLPVSKIAPKIQTSDVNSLGIKELIGRGTSYFAGSIPNRIYNINLAASRINGVLIPPGEVFSFNDKVGDISAESGYKQAYVIKSGRTVLDDGGGVCQDSTTLFRAVLNAGLPVTQRTAHAYRVGFYEQGFPPGLDATVFAPSVDFKFKNDTPSHILIQAYTAGTTLYVDLYGTSDGRNVVLSKSVVTDRVPAPDPLYQDDPTLPKGTTKQVDWAAQGAKVKFTRSVYRNGEEIIKETWNSFYKPWQAIYLVGTKE